jgi:kinetochore protein Mis13/DSN1
MNNQSERRHSKRLAGTSSLPLLPSRPLPSSQDLDPPHTAAAKGTKGRKRKDASADQPSSAAAAVYDEQDGDFLFTRGSKRVKTAPVPEVEEGLEDVPAPAPARVKKSVGRPPKAGTRRRASPPAPAPSPQPKSAAAPTTTRTSKRKSSLDSAPPPKEELAVPKSKTRRKARDSTAEKRSQRGGRAPQVNGVHPGIEEEEEYDNADEQQETTPSGPAQPQPQMIALPFSDTPIINRNKEFRKKGGASGSRRSSLGMRGRRASSLIDNGHSALPHREVDPSEFYKYIAAEGLSEPRRMKQLLIWCGERALSEKPPHGSHGSSAVLGGKWPESEDNAIEELLTGYAAQHAQYKTSSSKTLARDPSSRTGLREKTRPNRPSPSSCSPIRATSTTTPKSPSSKPRSRGNAPPPFPSSPSCSPI